MTALWAYLALSVLLGWGCIAGPWGTKAQEPGTPLSDQEYHQFFQFLRITIQVRTACQLRELHGCKNSLVQRLDEYENHGVIPSGPICSELPGNHFFHNFCTFSLYRCIMKQYFLKRTVCPGHRVTQRIQAGASSIMSSDAMPSSSFGPLPVPPTLPTSHSSPETEAPVIPTPLPVSPEPIPSGPAEDTEVTASGQQQGHLPKSDIEDLLLRILDSQVQTSLQTMKLLMSVGKVVKEEELQRAATTLLLALNNANVSWSPTN